MVEGNRRRVAPTRSRTVVKTDEFERWTRTLNAERTAKVSGAIDRVAEGGPTLGRPRVDVIHGSRLPKLKEARVDRGIRLLFAFDSRQNVVMLLGGDKAGRWKRWYPLKIKLAERLYAEHERGIGKESRCLSPRAGRTTSTGRSR
jgi:hypothetical protein